MKINRLELIQILKKRVEDAEAARDKTHREALTDYENAVEKYFTDTAKAWLDFSELIKRSVSNNTVTMLNRDSIPKPLRTRFSGELRFFENKLPKKADMGETESQLRRLIEILESSSDEQVSTYSLEKLGFPIGRVLR